MINNRQKNEIVARVDTLLDIIDEYNAIGKRFADTVDRWYAQAHDDETLWEFMERTCVIDSIETDLKDLAKAYERCEGLTS